MLHPNHPGLFQPRYGRPIRTTQSLLNIKLGHNTHRAITKPLHMGVPYSTVQEWLSAYDRDAITIGVVASHSSLQILHGARQEGFKTLGIAVGENRRRFYKAFPGADPDEWLMLDDYREMLDHAEWFREKNDSCSTWLSGRISWSDKLQKFECSNLR